MVELKLKMLPGLGQPILSLQQFRSANNRPTQFGKMTFCVDSPKHVGARSTVVRENRRFDCPPHRCRPSFFATADSTGTCVTWDIVMPLRLIGWPRRSRNFSRTRSDSRVLKAALFFGWSYHPA